MHNARWPAWVLMLAIVATVAIVLVNTPWDLGHWLAWLQRAPPFYVVAAVLVAPLFGVPLSPLLASMTIVFPFWSALWIVTLTIIFHHVLVWLVMRSPAAHWLRVKMYQRHLLPPSREHSSWSDDLLFIFTTTWIPGISYIFKPAYLLLAGIDTRVFLIFGSLSQVVAALPYLLLGQAAGSGHFFWFSLALFLLFALAWVLKRYIFSRRVSLEGGSEK